MIKSAPAEVAPTRETGTRLAAIAAAIPSSFRKVGTGIDVPMRGAFSTAGDVDNEDEDEEDLPLNNATTTAALGERTSCLWINFFFIILAMGRLNR
jgi:hypothetical protein